jgi:hypothetical protein
VRTRSYRDFVKGIVALENGQTGKEWSNRESHELRNPELRCLGIVDLRHGRHICCRICCQSLLELEDRDFLARELALENLILALEGFVLVYGCLFLGHNCPKLALQSLDLELSKHRCALQRLKMPLYGILLAGLLVIGVCHGY